MFSNARRLAPWSARLGRRRLNVAVGISGGVDSAVTALLLKQQGHNVTGVHMSNWDAKAQGHEAYCFSESDATSAATICRELDIPFHHVTFSRQYMTDVFQVFLQEIRSGLAPNPNVMCNRSIDYCLKELRQDKIATGHFARLHHTADDFTDKPTLLRGVDSKRDQTYFLSRVIRSRFQNVLFPLGSFSKEQVREIAVNAGLSCASRKSSTGFCFLGERHRFKEFLRQYIKPRSNGIFVDLEGNTLVNRNSKPRSPISHDGHELFTVGQRFHILGTEMPMFVSAKNAERNSITVVPTRSHAALFHDKLRVVDMEWLQDVTELLRSVSFENSGFHCQVSIRFRGTAVPCIMRPTARPNTLSVHLTSLLPKAISVGQVMLEPIHHSLLLSPDHKLRYSTKEAYVWEVLEYPTQGRAIIT